MKSPEQFNTYSEEQALDEAQKMREKVETREVENYSEAERLIENEQKLKELLNDREEFKTEDILLDIIKHTESSHTKDIVDILLSNKKLLETKGSGTFDFLKYKLKASDSSDLFTAIYHSCNLLSQQKSRAPKTECPTNIYISLRALS